MSVKDVGVRRHSKARLVVAAVAASALLGPTNIGPSARADDRLHRRQETAADRLKGARREYDAASRAVVRAYGALRQARKQLSEGEAALDARRAQLVTARFDHRRAQGELVEASHRLDDAQTRLRSGRERSEVLRSAWRQQIVSDYESGGIALGTLSTMLTGTDPTELVQQLAGLEAVNDSYAATIGRATASLTLLDVYKNELAAARAAVQAQVDETQRRLEAVTGAELAAEEARDRVASLVARRTDAAAAAAAARARDAAQVRRLRAEQVRIERMLRKRAAAAEAAAKAAANGSGLRDQNVGTGWDWPVSGWVSTPFGWRTHPIYGYRSYHNGIDIAAACGIPVRAPMSGRVLSAYFQSAYGNRVLIDHGAPGGVGTATEYNHLERWVVSPEQRVVRGQVVGYVGNTGWSTGCHLHFTIYRRGMPVDPLPLLR